jgi:hypothetical protein
MSHWGLSTKRLTGVQAKPRRQIKVKLTQKPDPSGKRLLQAFERLLQAAKGK